PLRGERRGGGLALAFALLVACDKAPEPKPAPVVSTASSTSSTSSSAAPLPEVKTRYAAAERVVAIGDVHGDLAATRAALKLAGLIDDRDVWTGGHTVLVQT